MNPKISPTDFPKVRNRGVMGANLVAVLVNPQLIMDQRTRLAALNDATGDARLDYLLHRYFRLGTPDASRKGSSRKRAHPTAAQNADESPDAILKQIKRFLRDSKDEKHVERVLLAVQTQLGKALRHAPLLPLAGALSTELFARSAAFRGLIATQAAAFFEKLLGAAGEKNIASKRRRAGGRAKGIAAVQSDAVNMVLGMIEQWKDEHGPRYPTIVAGYAGLIEMGYEFPRVKEKSVEAQREAQRRKEQQLSVRQVRAAKMEKEMQTGVPEMEATLAEMDSIFEILVPTLEAFDAGEDDEVVAVNRSESNSDGGIQDDHDEEVSWEDVPSTVGERSQEDTDGEDGVEWEDVHDQDETVDDEETPMHDMDMNEIVQAYGLGSSSYQLTITIPTTVCEKSAENEVLFRNLADGVLLIRKRFLPLVRDWLQVADSDTTSIGERCDVALVRRLQQLASRLEAATLKWEDLVKESERKRFARIQPRVVSLPLAAFSGRSASLKRRRPAAAAVRL